MRLNQEETLSNGKGEHLLNQVSFYLSLVVRKPVLGVSDKVPHKPGCAAT